MSPVRAWSFPILLVAAGCSTPPLAGEYEGPDRPRQAAAGIPDDVWVPAKLELVADGSCWWHPARDTRGVASILTVLGRWHLDATGSDRRVVVVHPDQKDAARTLRFDVAQAEGQTVLIAEDGSRLVRKG